MGNISIQERSCTNVIYDWLIATKPEELFSAYEVKEALPEEDRITIAGCLSSLERSGVIEAVKKDKPKGVRRVILYYRYIGPNHGIKFKRRPEKKSYPTKTYTKPRKMRKFQDFNQEVPKYYRPNGNPPGRPPGQKRIVNSSQRQFTPAPFHERLFQMAVEAESLLQSYSDEALLMELRRRGLKLGEVS